MLDEQVFRAEVSKLKRLIHQDPEVLARYDQDADGQISGDEWDRALSMLRRELERRPAQPAVATRAAFEAVRGVLELEPAGTTLTECPEIVVQQKVEGYEVALGWETRNQYVFRDPATGRELGGAEEAGGGVGNALLRQVLGPARPLRLSITDATQGVWMEGDRPFSLLAFIRPPELSVSWNGGPLGTVRRVWPLLLRRRYVIRPAGGARPDLLVDGTLFHPWTFPVTRDGRQVGSILKKWSGAARELFTDADTFLVRFEDPALDAGERRLLLAAALAIDFDFFERSSNR